jgi:hypothetical protein
MRYEIDYRKIGAKEEVEKLLDSWIASVKKEKMEIQIIHVVSGDFENDFELHYGTEIEFNGWQCDWTHSIDYKGYEFEVSGEAWYGKILITCE